MPIQSNLNVTPYYDDFDADKNYQRILYKAGYPIQARELTQQQTILQDQQELLHSRILNEGTALTGGEHSLRNPVTYVRLSNSYTRRTNHRLYWVCLTGATSGVTATVITVLPADEENDDTLYVSYTDKDTTGDFLTFLEGEVLESNHPNALTATVGITGVSAPIDTNAMGNSCLFTVEEGSFFVNGLQFALNSRPSFSIDIEPTPPFKLVLLLSKRSSRHLTTLLC